MSKDYGEIICTAVDEIVKARLEGLAFNITKSCTIINNDNRRNGEYIVSDGNAPFKALSQETGYAVNDSVLVLIPNGDYNNDKLILSKINQTEAIPHNYVSPMSNMITLTNNVLHNATYASDIQNTGELLANHPNDKSVTLYDFKHNVHYLNGHTRMGLVANFKSLLQGIDVKSGTYGLLITIESLVGQDEEEISQIHNFTFTSNEMAGNPYVFTNFFTQEKVFDISFIENIQKITIDFYQESNFKDSLGNSIPYQTTESANIEKEDLPKNLFVDNIQLYFGSSMSEFDQESITLYTNDIKSYHYQRENNDKELQVRWIHKINDNQYIPLVPGELDTNLYELRWYKYNSKVVAAGESENGQLDPAAGPGWERIGVSNDTTSIKFTPNLKKLKENIKVVGVIKNKTNEYYTSNILELTNGEYVPDETISEVASGLSIQCLDKSSGNYFLYDQNGKIKNNGIGNGYIRSLAPMWNNIQIDIDTFVGQKFDYVEWHFPLVNTMITSVEEYVTQGDYGIIHKDFSKDLAKSDLEFDYNIKNYWALQAANNTIQCIISVNGTEYKVLKELQFGRSGSNGTNLTMVLEFDNNANAIEIGGSATLGVTARLYDSNGSRIDFTETEASNIKWSWYRETTNGDYIQLSGELDDKGILTGQQITLTSSLTAVPTDNYYILQAVYTSNILDTKLTAFLPIPIKLTGYSHIEGATEVIYNHQGIPSYYKDAYKLFKYENKQYSEVSGDWSYTIGIDEEYEDYPPTSMLPTLSRSSGNKYVGLVAPQFFTEGEYDKLCVTCSFTPSDSYQIVYWSQPVLIMQSKYDFAMLNEWNQELIIDEKKGTILSTMLGAGKKINNQYYGVLIGDIQGGAGLSSTEYHTGVYGLNAGQLSFGFRDNGTAFIGKNGAGQIRFDGNYGIIESASDTGMSIDLQTGQIDATNFSLTAGSLELNSTQSADGYYFKVGDANNHIRFGNDLNIKTNNFELNSNLPSNGYYFKVGDENNYIHFDTALDIQTNAFNLNTEKLKLSSDGRNNYYFYIGDTDSFIAYSEDDNLAINVKDLTLKSAGIELYSNDQKDTQTIGSSEALKTWRIIAGENFGVTSDGALYASNVNISGGRLKIGDNFEVTTDGKVTAKNIEATGGTIGGWTILGGSDQYLKSSNEGDSLYLFGLGDGTATINSVEIKDLVIRVGGSGSSSPASFGIGVNGMLYASSVNLRGKIDVTSGNFASGCTIGSQFEIVDIVQDGQTQTVFHTNGANFAGMGYLGAITSNKVYIGSDGMSYATTTASRWTSIRPGIVFCTGNNQSCVLRETGLYYYDTSSPQGASGAKHFYYTNNEWSSDLTIYCPELRVGTERLTEALINKLVNLDTSKYLTKSNLDSYATQEWVRNELSKYQLKQ